MNAESSDPKQENEGHSTLKSPVMNTNPVMQQKEMELESSIFARDTGKRPFLITENRAVDEGEHLKICSKVSIVFVLSLGNNTVSGVPKVGDIVEKQQTSSNSDTLREEHATECKDKELERSVQTCNVMNYANSVDEDEDIEDGEISGDYRESDDLMDILLQDAVVSKDKQASEACLEEREFSYNKANQEGLELCALLMDTNDSSKNGRIAKFSESDRIMVSIAKTSVSGISIKADRPDGYDINVEFGKVEKKDDIARTNCQALQGQVLEGDAAKDHQITLTEEVFFSLTFAIIELIGNLLVGFPSNISLNLFLNCLVKIIL